MRCCGVASEVAAARRSGVVGCVATNGDNVVVVFPGKRDSAEAVTDRSTPAGEAATGGMLPFCCAGGDEEGEARGAATVMVRAAADAIGRAAVPFCCVGGDEEGEGCNAALVAISAAADAAGGAAAGTAVGGVPSFCRTGGEGEGEEGRR